MPVFKRSNKNGEHFKLDVVLDTLLVPEEPSADTYSIVITRKGKKLSPPQDYYISEPITKLNIPISASITLFKTKSGSFEDKFFDIELYTRSFGIRYARFSFNASSFITEGRPYKTELCNIDDTPSAILLNEFKLTVSISCTSQSHRVREESSDLLSAVSSISQQSQKRNLSNVLLSEPRCQSERSSKMCKIEICVEEYDELLKDLVAKTPDRHYSYQSSPSVWDIRKNREIVQLEEDLIEALHEQNKVTSELARTITQNKMLEKELNYMLQEKNSLSSELILLKDKVSSLSDELKTITDQRDCYKGNIRQLEKESELNKSLSSKVEFLRNKNFELSSKLRHISEKFEEKLDEFDELKLAFSQSESNRKVEDLHLQLIVQESYVKDLSLKLIMNEQTRRKLQQTITEGLNEKNELKDKIDSLQFQLNGNGGNNDYLLGKLKFQLVEAEEAARNFELETKKLNDELECTKALHHSSKNENSKLKEEVASLKLQLDQKSQIILDHESELQNPVKILKSCDNCVTWALKLENEQSKMEILRNDYCAASSKAEVDLAALKEVLMEKEILLEREKGQCARLNMQLSQSRQQISCLSKQLLETEADTESPPSLVEDNQLLENTNLTCVVRTVNDSDYDELQQLLKETKQRSAQLELSLSQACNLTMEKNVEIKSLRKKIEELERKTEDSEAFELKREIAYRDEHIKVLESELEKSENEKEDFITKWKQSEYALSEIKRSMLNPLSELKHKKARSLSDAANNRLMKKLSEINEIKQTLDATTSQLLIAEKNMKKLEHEASENHAKLKLMSKALKTLTTEKNQKKIFGAKRNITLKEMQLNFDEISQITADMSPRNPSQNTVLEKKRSTGKLLSWVRR